MANSAASCCNPTGQLEKKALLGCAVVSNERDNGVGSQAIVQQSQEEAYRITAVVVVALMVVAAVVAALVLSVEVAGLAVAVMEMVVVVVVVEEALKYMLFLGTSGISMNDAYMI